MKPLPRENRHNTKPGKRRPPKEKQSLFCGITSDLKAPCCTILESISDGVFTIDLDKRITSLNRAAESITGFKSEEAIGQYCFDVFRADICEKNCALEETLTTGKPKVNVDAQMISKSGTQKPISISTAVLRDGTNQIIGGVETFRDLSELEKLKRHLYRSFTDEDIIGRHPRMKEILSSLPDIAESESSVLIQGPTGSGKELIARSVHQLSPRKTGPFVAVNCAALPETLLESELFGYTKGAFTGAVRNKAGRVLLANKGTLFLDEIASTSLAFQADLLRVLEDGEFTPLGATKSVKADFRLVTATNQDLRHLVGEGKFREDLYYRLNVAKISLPPLKERKEDIPLLVDHFVHKLNFIKGKKIEGVSSDERLGGLEERPRRGRPRVFPPEIVLEIKALACQLPKDLGLPFSRLSRDEIARQAIKRGVVASISGATVWRWLSADAIRPWCYRSWIWPRDPYFEQRAGRVLDLYHRTWNAKALGENIFVVCSDEKTSVQARRRLIPTIPPVASRAGRVEHEYDREGALAYLAACDVHHAKRFGLCRPSTGIVHFHELVDLVMNQQPYRSARRVFWIADNGSSHRGRKANDRLRSWYPNAVLVNTPVHASWLNQVEIYFSILQRKVLTPNDFDNLQELESRINSFQSLYEERAKPFEWKFTRDDLKNLLSRLSLSEQEYKKAA